MRDFGSIVRHLCVVVALAGFLAAPPAIDAAQFGGIGGAIGRAADRVVNRTENRLGRRVETALGNAIACAIGDQACIDEAEANGDQVVIADADGNIITDASGQPATNQDDAQAILSDRNAPAEDGASDGEVGQGVWRNYDFVPGHTVWVATDFSRERVGRFPASQLEFVGGNMQIVEMGDERLLEVASASVLRLQLPENLPDGFSLEFDLSIAAQNAGTTVFFAGIETSVSQYDSHYILVSGNPGIYRGGLAVSSLQKREITGVMTPIKFQADGSYAVLYAGEERVGNVPNVSFPRGDFIEFRITANTNLRAYLNNIVVAVGLDPLYETLLDDGAVTTRGILFDVNGDRLRPESTAVLNQIQEMLEDHGELNILIEGHTDDTGEDAYNLELSARRAQAVVDYLVGQGISRDRLTAVGKGEAEPAVPNDGPEGREQNRRVVIRQPV